MELEVRELLTFYEFPGDDIPVVRGSALKAMQGDADAENQITGADGCGGQLRTDTAARDREAVFDAGGRHIHDIGARDGGDGESGAREGPGRRRNRDRRDPADTVKRVVTGVEMFRKLLDEGLAGDNVGLLLRGTDKSEVERGQVIAAPGSITPHTHFKAQAYVLTKEEGGRHTPFFNGYRPQFYFRTTDVTGVAELPEGTEMVMPGDNVNLTIKLITPIAMEKGLRFAIREGGRTVGAGTISEILE